ncbi:DUF1697 domain-containing protein [Winogradskyella sp. PG-2]|uniref:DUF1697 domain-containing protein n=1 Tax=Winogradskyella sp. PG-2 TaxID=754409 RepID=UPI0004588E78|nr:DUF1697 domain-containing protein [Winogradskyella sp. PG-2]BAO76020.1 hypothetical protein WPG_1790 [Winogradskyella sp. PG-2]
MKTYIALLRGINVGGHKKVPMAELSELLTKSGFESVRTYIQSGNVIFKCREIPLSKLANGIQKSIKVHFGFDVSVLVRTRDQINTIFDNCPFPEEKKVNSYFAMLSEIPDNDLVKEACEKTYENEEYKILNDCLYFYCANGYGKAKFSMNYFEKKLEVAATSRNYKTMVKLLALSEN